VHFNLFENIRSNPESIISKTSFFRSIRGKYVTFTFFFNGHVSTQQPWIDYK